MRTIATRLSIVFAMISIAFCTGTTTWGSCLGGALVAHVAGGYFARCIDSQPIASFAFALANPGSVHTNGQDLVCEAEGGSSELGTGCAPEAGIAGDGRVTVAYDWGLPGAAGCPVPYGQPYGDLRIVLILATSDGSSLVTSLGYFRDAEAYFVDAVEPYTGTSLSPLYCGLAEGDVLHLDRFVQTGGQVTGDLTLLAPRIFSDCDPGTLGQVMGSCPSGPSSIPAGSPGRLYSRVGPCPDVGGAVNLEASAWTFAATPDSSGHVSIALPAPPQNECLLLGATFSLGGVERPAIGGFVRIPPPACKDADFDGVTDCAGDCNDSNPEVFPGHAEACDGVDNDCDGLVDEGSVCSLTCASPGKVGADVRVTFNGPMGSVDPALVWTGDGYGVAWWDVRDDPETAIYFARLDATGAKIGGDVRVSSGQALAVAPKLAWTGSGFGVLWQDYEPIDATSGTSGLRFARLDAAGQKIGDDLRLTGDRVIEPELIWTGTEYGVAWADANFGNYIIMFTRLDASGNRVSPDVRATNVSADSSHTPRLVWTGSEYGLAWLSLSSFPSVKFIRLDATGQPIGTETTVSLSGSVEWSPLSMVSTGSGFGIAWETSRSGHKEILFARLDATGRRLGLEVAPTDDPFVSQQPSLAWTGAEYGLSWLDDRDGNHEVYYTRIDPAGSKVGTDLRVTVDPAWTWRPSLVWHGSGYGWPGRICGTTTGRSTSRVSAATASIWTGTALPAVRRAMTSMRASILGPSRSAMASTTTPTG